MYESIQASDAAYAGQFHLASAVRAYLTPFMSSSRIMNLSCLGLTLLSSILLWGKVMLPQVSRGLHLQLTSGQTKELHVDPRSQEPQRSVPAQGRPIGRMRGGSSR